MTDCVEFSFLLSRVKFTWFLPKLLISIIHIIDTYTTKFKIDTEIRNAHINFDL